MSVQLRNTLFRNDYVVLALSDHSGNAKEVAKQLRQCNYFDECIFCHSKKIDKEKHEGVVGIRTAYFIASGKYDSYGSLLSVRRFDDFIYYNFNTSTLIWFAILYRYNRDLFCSRLEEGILSYAMLNQDIKTTAFKGRIGNICRKILGRKTIGDCIKYQYCFMPEHYKGKLNIVPVSPFKPYDQILKQSLSQIFAIETDRLSYSRKYIYFSSVCDFEGGEAVGEIDLVVRIAGIVGADNLLVKVHPRDTIDRFLKRGLYVDVNSSVPWEVIQINYDFSDHVFLTLTSSSVITMNMCMENPIKTYFLYRCCDLKNNKVAVESARYIEKIFGELANAQESWLHLTGDLGEIL